MIVSAHLRSYLPEDDLPTYRRVSGSGVSPLRADNHFLWREPGTDDAFIVSWGGTTYVCPRNFQLRKLEGVLAFNNAFPDAGLVSQSVITKASIELERLRDSSRLMRSYVLTSPWHVPIRWFGAFLHDEREIYESSHGMSIRYRALMGDARGRVHRAAEIIAGAGFDPAVVGQVRSLFSWIDGFANDAMLELDYGEVATLFTEGDLVLDDSSADVAASLHALDQGDMETAATHYATLTRRWGHAQALAFSS